MAIFEDPIRALHVGLPSGWALDPFSSTLTRLFFAPWNRVDEVVIVSVEPARVPAPATDEAWLAAVRDEVTATSDFLDLPSTSGRAVAAETHPPSGSLQRVALVRGPRVDFVLEHNGADSADPQPWATLSAAVLHISSAANTNPGPAFSPAQIHAAVQAGLQAMQAGDRAALLRSFADAVRISTSSFLHTLTSFDEAVQVATAIEVARILASFAYVTRQEILLLRDADQVMDRAGRSAAAIQSSAGQPLAQNVATGLSAIEAELRGRIAPEQKQPWRRVQALSQRAEWLVTHALEANQSGSLESARSLAFAAQQDLLALAVQRRRGAAQVPPDPALWAAGERTWATRLYQVVEVLYRCAADRQDTDAASDATKLLMEIAAVLVSVAPDAASLTRSLQAAALMQHAGQLLDYGDDALLSAEKLLEQADSLLDQHGPLRAQLFMNLGWVRFYLKKFSESKEAVDRGLLETGSDIPTELRRSLHALKAQLLLSGGESAEAVHEADQAIDDAPSPLSTHLLIRALAKRAAYGADGALRDLREAIATAAADNALGQDLLQILFAASELVEAQDVGLSLDLAWAAQSVMDARSIALQAETQRISFADAARQRQVAETLVSRLIDADAFGSALAASDQTRARSFYQLLSIAKQIPAARSAPPSRCTLTATEDDFEDLRQASAAIRSLAAQTLAAAGSPVLLSSDEILALVADAGVHALALQPVGERIHLFLLLPRGDVRLIVAESPLPASQVAAACELLQAELGIRAATRGLPPLVDTDDDDMQPINDAIRVLSEALIQPIATGLEPGSPLIVVPYRDFALIPFPLLTLTDGRQIVDAHAVSLAPSFASLSLLRQPHPSSAAPRCFVAGDPLTDPKYRLIPLEGASREAADVRDLLLASGVPAASLSFHLHEQATETAWRREARGAHLVHLACHATVREPASQSALFLAADAANDGQLSPAEIAMVRLDGALVFLSACQTGLGHPTADGVLGLSRAFLEAGARAVVMSMWKVADESTAVLARYFYQHLLGAPPDSAAEALRQAMVAARAELRAGRVISSRNEVLDDHPANWAPFLLLGDGGFLFHA